MDERIQKVLARAGIASRRHAEELLQDGRVSVNGRIVRTPGTRVDPASDRVAVDGRVIRLPPAFTYFALHKPAGVVSTARDDRGRPTVLDLVPTDGRLFPVGRLDRESEGLIVLTDDGALAQRLTHPRYAVEKEYQVLVRGVPAEWALSRLRRGIRLDEGLTAPADVTVLDSDGARTWLGVTLRQGWKRQVRRMFAVVGHPVERLVRVRIGALRLGDLPLGAARRLAPHEVAALAGRPRRDDDRAADRRARRSGRGGEDDRRPAPGRAARLGLP